MLTINADDDPLFRDYHQAGEEKRMVVILPEGAYGDWLTAPAEASREFLIPFPSDRLIAIPMKRPRFCCNILCFYPVTLTAKSCSAPLHEPIVWAKSAPTSTPGPLSQAPFACTRSCVKT